MPVISYSLESLCGVFQGFENHNMIETPMYVVGIFIQIVFKVDFTKNERKLQFHVTMSFCE